VSFHPLFYVIAKSKARQACRDKGMSLIESFQATADLAPEVVDMAVADEKVTVPPEFAAGTAGAVGAAGGIFAAILAFFSSALGQQLIAALLKLLGL
jgi:hypothetical protein